MKHYLNTQTGTLHIDGYCRFTNPVPKEYLKFDTEEEAHAYGGLSIGLCKFCLNKRQQIMDESKCK